MKKPKQKKKKRSLQRVAVYSTLIGAFLFLLILSVVELVLHVYAIMGNYKAEAKHEGSFVMSLIDPAYVERIFAETKANYASIPEELRQQQFTDAYRERCAVVIDEDFFTAREILVKCREETGMRNIQMEFYDPENDRMVVVLDGDEPDYAYIPGQWLSDEGAGVIENPKQIAYIMNSDWYMPVGYGAVSGWTATDYMEITDTQGNPIGYLVMNIDINEFSIRLRSFLIVYIPTLIGVLVLAAFWIARRLRKRIVDPVNQLAVAARNYTRRDKAVETPKESYFADLQIDTGDEIEELWESMTDMERDMTKTLSRVRVVTAERERLRQERVRIVAELDIARDIQQAAIPSTFPAFPERKEFDLYAAMTPAKEVGGDFYDFFLLDADHLAIAIADVAGKGIPAALFMMISKQTLRNHALHGGTPSEVLSYVNDHLCENNPNEMFVTIWFGILTISTGEIIACSAGHEYPAILTDTGKYVLFEEPHGLACGAMPGMPYEDYTFRLPKGGRILVYTDGVVEAHNEKDELLGFEEIVNELNKGEDAAPRETVERILKRIQEFAGACEQFDDITLLNLWYKGTESV
ncbi:MAG: PP2C family protein-serine/threonine phosphatase [Lachnospiraceae bacterium]|nr:PP2C family protein-serine/threonine phosphatase [Lachnospiraceae bacterium]